jgi:hypothetical protein
MLYRGQDEVSKGRTGFHRKFNEFLGIDLEEGDFYDNCPKLSQEARDQLKAELSEVDLFVVLNA